MGIVFRQSAKTSIVVFLGAILGALVIWLSTRYIPKQELGFTNTLTNLATTISQIILLGFNSTMIVYIHRYADDDRKRKLLLTLCLGLPAIVIGIFTLLYYFLQSWIIAHFRAEDAPFMRQYFVLLPFYTFLFMYLILFEQYLGSQLKIAVSAFMREVLLRVLNIALLLLFAFGFISFNVLVVTTVLLYVIPVTIFFYLSWKTKGFGFSFKLSSFSIKEYKELGGFCWYHFLLGSSIILISIMDMILLPFYDKSGFISVAIYRVPVFLISFMQLPLKALMPASYTVLAKAFTDNDTAKAKDLFIRSSINILIPTIAIASILCCNLSNIVSIIKNGYSDIIPVFSILFVGSIVNIATGMNDQVLSITNYYKFNFYLSLALILFLFIMIKLLVPHYGIYGAAWSTSITFVIFNSLKCFYVWKKLDMQPFSKNTLLVMFAGAGALLAGYFFPHFLDQSHHVYIRTFIDVAMRSTVIVIIYGIMLLWLKPSNDLQEYIASIKKNKRLF